MSYYVYILKSLKDNRYYIESTADVESRVAFHNAGLQRSTRKRIPFELVMVEEFELKILALQREKEIKNWKGGEAFKKLLRGK